jgi:energy-coupling factor transporter ATP-binding protein EcfA2
MSLDIRNIDWGVGEAKAEIKQMKNDYANIFVNIDTDMINEKHHLFIWGRRGSGKTAMAWKLSNVSPEENTKVINIDFEDAATWVDYVLSKANNLKKIEGVPFRKSCSDLWYNSIMAEMMRVMLNGENIGLEGDDKIDGCSRGRGIFQRLVKNIEDFIKWLEQNGFFTINNNHSRELSAVALPTIDKYLQNSTNFTRDATMVFETMVPKVRIIVDSVDKLIDAPAFKEMAEENYKTLALVVRSLTEALVRIYVDERFKDLVEIKAFLPMDLEPFLQDRAFDHEYIYHHHIHWNRKELAALVAKRIARTTKMSTPSGDYVGTLAETWDELFPFSISNVETNVKHKSFDYLLRHSQYRPREILRCCRAMTEHARKEKKSSLTDKEYVNLIHKHCQYEAIRIIDEYILAYPTLYEVLEKFNGSSNIIPSEELYPKLRKIPVLPGPIKDHTDLLQFLYDIGFLGIVVGQHEMNALGTYLPYTIYKGKNLYFAFKNFDPDRSVASVKTFVIHPIFYGRFAIKANPNITICHILGSS